LSGANRPHRCGVEFPRIFRKHSAHQEPTHPTIQLSTFGNSDVAKDKGHLCIPEGVSSKQMVLIVKKAMTADLAAFPEDKNMPAVSFVAASMQQAFPCGK
jgi:hypothetical protein